MFCRRPIGIRSLSLNKLLFSPVTPGDPLQTLASVKSKWVSHGEMCVRAQKTVGYYEVLRLLLPFSWFIRVYVISFR